MPVVVFDHDEKIVHFNAECQRLTGLRETDVIGSLPWEKIFSREEPQWFKTLLAEVNAGNFKPLIKAHVCTAPDGQEITIPWRYNLVVDENSQIKYLVATGNNFQNP
jgi:PAS domain S-box-containing protein